MPTTPITPPMQCLLALCSAGRIDPKPLATALSETDWQTCWALAERHRVIPIIAESLKHQPTIPVPDSFQARLKQAIQQNVVQTLKNAAELVRLTQQFDEHKIPFVTFKGIALAHQMGLQFHQRHAGDIDLLLADQNDILRADAFIMAAGYQRTNPSADILSNRRQRQHFIRHVKDFTYQHPDTGVRLELHYRLLPNTAMCEYPPGSIYQRRSTCLIGQTAVPCMNQTDHQLYLLLHGALSHWFRLKWLSDIPIISHQGQAYQQPEFWQQAQALGIERMMALGLNLAHQLIKMPISTPVAQYHDNQPVIQRLTQQARSALLRPKPMYTDLKSLNDKITWYFSYRTRHQLALKQGLPYKIRWLGTYATDIDDWQTLPLPNALFFLYYPLRPFIWLYQQLK